MRVVENDLEGMLGVDVHATGRLKVGRVKGAQTVTYVLQIDAHIQSQRTGEHSVLHVVQRATFEGGGNQVGPQ